MPTTTLKTIRQKVAKKLYAGRFPIVSVTTADSDSLTVLKDTVLSPAAQIEDFIEAWIIVAEQPAKADVGKNVSDGDFNATESTFTMESSHGIVVGDGLQIDSEIMRVTAVSTDLITVVRGIQSTTAATHANASDVFIIGPEVQEIARVTDVTFSGSNSQLTVAPGFSASLVSGTDYEIHYKFYPQHLRDKINEILENLRRDILLSLTLVTDGDMEGSGTGDWTASGTGGTPTLAKNTTAANVVHGRRSLSITNDGSTTVGLAKSASVNVSENRNVFVSADVFITAGDKAKLTLRDITAGADIETAESLATGLVHFEFTATVPADCEDIQVWLESVAASDVTYWSAVTLLFSNRQVYDYPSTLEWSEDFDKVLYFPKGSALTNTGEDLSFEIFTKPAVIWSPAEMIRDSTALNPYRLMLKKGTINQPLMIGGRVDFDTVSADTDTTTAPEDIVVNLVYADMLDAWAQEDIVDDKFQAAQVKMSKAENVRRILGPRMQHFYKPKARVHGTRGR